MPPGKSGGSIIGQESDTGPSRFAGKFTHPTRKNMKHAKTWVGSRSTLAVFAAVPLMAPEGALLGSAHPEPPGPVGFVVHTNYHGWSNSILVSNGRVEAVVVAAIGLVVEFRL